MSHRHLMIGSFALVAIIMVSVIAFCANPTPTRVPFEPARPASARTPVQQQDDRYKKNDSYVMPAQVNEPAWPVPADADAVKKAGHAPFSGGYQFEVRGADGVRRSGVVVSGTIVLDRGLIELLGCAEGGKEYESVVRFECDVQALDQALRLSGCKPGPIPAQGAKEKEGTRVIMLLQWTAEGKTVAYRAEDIVLSSMRDKPMPRVGWTYVGHWAEIADPTSAEGRTYRVLAATGTRSLVTTYHDRGTLLDTPLEEAEQGAGAETLFAANYMLLPSPGTKVNIILRTPTAEEAKSIAETEKELKK